MNFIESYLPINTHEKILQLIYFIKVNGLMTVPYDDFVNQICCHIRKKNLQLMFREKIEILIITLKYNPVNYKSNKILGPVIKTQGNKQAFSKASYITETSVNSQQLRNNRIYTNYVEVVKKMDIQDENIKASPDSALNINSSNNNIVFEKHLSDEIDMYFLDNINGRNLKEAAKALNMVPKFLESILQKQNIKINEIFTTQDYKKIKTYITPFIKMLIPMKSEENTICNYVKKYNQRFSPSFGKEGNYHKLIYIKSK